MSNLREKLRATTVARARMIQKRLPIVDRLARGREDFACRADVYILLLVEREGGQVRSPDKFWPASLSGFLIGLLLVLIFAVVGWLH